MKVLEILGIYDEPKVKEEFLQHITEIINVKVEKGKSYIDFFELLKLKCLDENSVQAINDFIEFNLQEVGEDTLKGTIIDDEYDCYVVMNLFNM